MKPDPMVPVPGLKFPESDTPDIPPWLLRLAHGLSDANIQPQQLGTNASPLAAFLNGFLPSAANSFAGSVARREMNSPQNPTNRLALARLNQQNSIMDQKRREQAVKDASEAESRLAAHKKTLADEKRQAEKDQLERDRRTPGTQAYKDALQWEADLAAARGSARPARSAVGKAPDTAGDEDIKAIADAIERGEQPPTLTGLYRNTAALRGELGRRGFDLSKAQADYNAMTRYYAGLNQSLQVRLRQAAENAASSTDLVDEFSDELSRLIPRSNVSALNKTSLKAASDWGVFGPEAAAKATQLQGQIVALQSELSNVYSGGGVPTDEARRMAESIINVGMSPARLKAAAELARRDIRIRLNAINHAGMVSPSNPLIPGAEQRSINIGKNSMSVSGEKRPDWKLNPATGKLERVR